MTGTVETLTKAALSEHLSQKIGYSKVENDQFIESFFEEVAKALEAGEVVKLSSFGNFNLIDKNARPGRNPKTGAEAEISGRRVITFRPSQLMKDRVNIGNK